MRSKAFYERPWRRPGRAGCVLRRSTSGPGGGPRPTGLDRFALLLLAGQACQPQLVMHPHQRVHLPGLLVIGQYELGAAGQSAGCRRSSSHAYACHAARLGVVRVVRVLRFPAESNSSVTVVSGCPPRPMRAISLSHSTWASASAFFRAAENTEYSEGFAAITVARSALRSLPYPGTWAVLARARSSRSVVLSSAR